LEQLIQNVRSEHHAYNIGIFYWRSTEPAIQLAKEWLDLLTRKHNIWDQKGFRLLVNKNIGPSVEGGDGLVYAFDGSLKLGILPVSLFCSGHTYFIQVSLFSCLLQKFVFI